MLFTVLTLFFKLVVSKVETRAFQAEFKHLVDQKLDNDATLKKVMGSVVARRAMKSKNVKALHAAFAEPDAGVAQNNRWLFRTAFTGAAGMAAVVLALAWASHGEVPLGGLLLHNLVTFALVGVVEYVFFTQVAMKYQPAPPSVLIDSAMRAAKAAVASA
ncbi:hypothetical protein WJX74_008478 [Apatococcus lobatus]|uniref:Uncharacterized protein n=1 Tax=Apatococcus lobatus TaxID=904363 RepID=A0AAW1PR43_9CHLO